MASFGYGLRRRAPIDPFSEAARFPSLAQDDQAEAQSTFADLQNAGVQHLAAQADGANSVAARNDPLQYGSVFSRQHPGAFDAFRDSQRQDVSGGLPRRTELTPLTEPSATDRYAARFASQSTDPSSIATIGQGGHNPGRLLRRGLVNGVPTYDNY
jgi:hypothetical protein